MEFASEFVYLPPAPKLVTQVKISALLPPKKVRHPRHSPPAMPPKANPTPIALMPPKVPSPSRTSPSKPSPVYENLRFAPKQTQQTGNASSPPWKKHLEQKCSPPPVAPKPLRQTQNPTDREPDYEVPVAVVEQQQYDPTYSYSIPEGTGLKIPFSPPKPGCKLLKPVVAVVAPPLPPRPAFMKQCPEYDFVLPSPSPSSSSSSPILRLSRDRLHANSSPIPAGDVAKQPLVGNPNVVLLRLEKLLEEDQGEVMQGEPTSCSHCGSVLESCYDNVVKECYFCRSWDSGVPERPPGCEDHLFLLTPELSAHGTESSLLIFCIDTSHSSSVCAQVDGECSDSYRSRLHAVQEALLQCVQALSGSDPDLQITLVSFSDKVTLHGHGDAASQVVKGADLTNSNYLREVGLNFAAPPPLSVNQASLQMEIYKLQEGGCSALGPAVLISTAMASQRPGSKVVLWSCAAADAGLGCLSSRSSHQPHTHTHSPISSTIFYQELGETAAAHSVCVSVVCQEGTDCRLEQLGRLTDKTGGKVVIASCDELYVEFMKLINDKIFATHCTVTLLLPVTLTVIGEKEAGHCGIREVGIVTQQSDVTFQFGESANAHRLLRGRSVCVQVQVRFRGLGERSMLRVQTVTLETTEDSVCVLSSLCVSVLMVNVCHTSAALALRGRIRDAQQERDTQIQLIQRALDYRQNNEDECLYSRWLRTTNSIYKNLHKHTHSLSDDAAALMFAMKNSYRAVCPP